jgi:hypothetical protein
MTDEYSSREAVKVMRYKGFGKVCFENAAITGSVSGFGVLRFENAKPIGLRLIG